MTDALKGSRLERVITGLLPTILVAAAFFNIATFRTYAQELGDRWGFRPGQSAELAERIRASGNTTLREEWHLHLRIGDLVEDDVLVLPRSAHPLDEELLTHMARIEWRVGSDLTVPGGLAEELVEREGLQIWANGDGTTVSLVPEESDDDADAWILARSPTAVGDPAVQWFVVPAQEIDGDER